MVFDPARAAFLAERRKRAGHLQSKHRFIAAQFGGLSRRRPVGSSCPSRQRHGRPVGAGAQAVGLAPVWPVEANLVFVVLPRALDARLKAAGADYYVRPSETLAIGPTIKCWRGSLLRLQPKTRMLSAFCACARISQHGSPDMPEDDIPTATPPTTSSTSRRHLPITMSTAPIRLAVA